MPTVHFAEVPNKSSISIIAAHLLYCLYNIVARGVLDLQPKFQKLCVAMDPFSCNCF